MSYLTAKQFSEKWGISERRINCLCQEGRICGATKNGKNWMIPEDTMKPIDKRNKISTYINIQKRVLVANINTEIGYQLLPLLKKEGYLVEGICDEKARVDKPKIENIKVFKADFENRTKLEECLKKTEKYYDGLIFIDTNLSSEEFLKNKEWFIIKLAQKMDCESSVVLVNNRKNAKAKLEAKLAKKSREKIGFRINSINSDVPSQEEIFLPKDVAEDICMLFTKFKNTTGMAITTDGGYLEFNENGRTKDLETGIFYRVIGQYFKKLNQKSYLWCASTMLQDEWTEEPLEMNFRVLNLDCASRGVKIERIFIFRESQIKEFKNNKTLQIYMQSNIHTMFVNYHEILEKEPELLKIVGSGWDGIDNDVLIADLPSESRARGYVSRNKREVKKARECFERLKTYAKDLKEVLK